MATFRDVNGGDLDDAARRNDHKLARWVSQNAVRTAGFRNAVINGGLDIWQRGTAPSASNATVYGPDMWGLAAVGASAVTTVNRSTHSPFSAEVVGSTGRYYGAFTWTVSSDTVNGYNGTVVHVEDVGTFANQTCTLSFWASGSGSPNVGVELEQSFGTGGSPSATNRVQIALASLTSTPRRFTYTFAMPSVSGKTLGTAGNDQLILNFWFALGSAYVGWGSGVGFQSGIGKQVNIWGVQLEAGSVATPFERRPWGTELAMCQRFFRRLSPFNIANGAIAVGVSWSTTNILFMLSFSEMRSGPSITVNGAMAQFWVLTTLNQPPSTLTQGDVTTTTGALNCTVATPVVSGGAAMLRWAGSSSGSIDLSAELP